MPSYVYPLIPPAVFVLAWLAGRSVARRPSIPVHGRRGAGFAVVACVAVGIAMALAGQPASVLAAEDAPAASSQEADTPAEKAETGDSAASTPADETKPAKEPEPAEGEEKPAVPTESAETAPEGQPDDAGQPQGEMAAGRQATLRGVNFNDRNGDGEQQPDGADGIPNTEDDERGLPDWEIRAYSDDDASGTLTDADDLAASATTTSEGTYVLSLEPGTYIVVEASRVGWAQSAPTTRVNTTKPAVAEFGYVKTLAAGQAAPDLDFGSFRAQIESWLARSAFNLTLLILLAAVVIGPFYLALRATGTWRQPLWGWPIGLIGAAVAGAAVVALVRWVCTFLPVVFSEVFERYLANLTNVWPLWVTVGLIAVPMWLGAYLARRWRMPDYGGKIAIVSFAMLAGIVVTVLGWPPKLGIDLSGGVILVYELEGAPGEEEPQPGEAEEEAADEQDEEADEEAAARERVDMDKLIQAIRLRADPGSVKELTIRPRGERQIEVIIPRADEQELDRIKRKISSAGTLEFRILANKRDHPSQIEQALQVEGRELRDADGNLLAWWVPVAKGEEEGLLRTSASAETVYRERTYRGYTWTEFLVVPDPFNVTGNYLVDARPSIDQSGRPNVLFTFNYRGGQLFGGLTGNNLPDESQDFSRHLGIILDGYLQSAPGIRSTIFERGEITGDFTRREVEDLVDILNAGSLPTALSEEPVSETYMGPGLGKDTIQRGRIAIGISVGLVLMFMLFYYRFAGIVACGALLMTLVMVLAVMISVRAAFTLPGLAGLVLTVGMAVDANVLIFERIREELGRQAKLRMAIRNGFGRATSAIVDANLTTLITATVLYVIGTDQIKGFAVTLWLGVVLSMFTAIYCSRVVFDIAERQKWITELKMARLLGKTQIDFLGMRRLAAPVSIVVIVVGLGAVVLRGSGLLDIDFTGGVSVHAVFETPQDIQNIREKLGEDGEGLDDLSVMNVPALGDVEPNVQFIINTSGPMDMPRDAEPEKVLAEVRKRLQSAFGASLAHHSLETALLAPQGETAKPEQKPEQKPAKKPAEEPAAPAPETESRNERPAAGLVASADLSSVLMLAAEPSEEAEAKVAPSAQEPPKEESAAPAEKPSKPEPKDAPTEPADATAASAEKPEAKQPAEAEEAAPTESTRARLEFENPVSYERLMKLFEGAIAKAQEEGDLPQSGVVVELFIDEECSTVDHEAVKDRWFAEISLPADQTQLLLDKIEARVESEPVFPSSNTIGGQVASGTRVDAVAALLASLVFIVAYIWIRFQRVMFGLAAVVALVHDVLITLGVIALTAYLAPVLGFLLIDEFKIGLAVLAAFLTIIGYSLNDTIVVFDRIREVRGKAPQLTGDMINTSINQTLSRTLLTSLTTLLVVVVLYIGGGQAIHVFAFALVVGVLVGTYSSVFVASPILYWMAQSQAVKAGRPRS